MQNEMVQLASSQAASTTGAKVSILGGVYALEVEGGTIATGNVLNVYAPDGTALPALAMTDTAGAFHSPLYLPPGQYSLTTASGNATVSAWLLRLPS